MNNVSIVCSALAAVFTAAPALGGAKAMQTLIDTFTDEYNHGRPH